MHAYRTNLEKDKKKIFRLLGGPQLSLTFVYLILSVKFVIILRYQYQTSYVFFTNPDLNSKH